MWYQIKIESVIRKGTPMA